MTSRSKTHKNGNGTILDPLAKIAASRGIVKAARKRFKTLKAELKEARRTFKQAKKQARRVRREAKAELRMLKSKNGMKLRKSTRKQSSSTKANGHKESTGRMKLPALALPTVSFSQTQAT